MQTTWKTQLKYARYTNHLQFPLRCLHDNLIPNDVYLKPQLRDLKNRKILDKASGHLLQNRINENHNIRKALRSSIEKAKCDLSNTLNQEHLYHAENSQLNLLKKLAKARERQLRKFTKLHVWKHSQEQAETSSQTPISTDKSKCVIHLSSHNNNEYEKELLEKE